MMTDRTAEANTQGAQTVFEGVRAFHLKDARHASSVMVALAEYEGGSKYIQFSLTDARGEVISRIVPDLSVEEQIARLREGSVGGFREEASLHAMIEASANPGRLRARIERFLSGGFPSLSPQNDLREVALPPRPSSEKPRRY